MVWALSYGIEVFSAVVFVVPVVFIFRSFIWKQRGFSRTVMLMIFGLYLTAVLSVTGIPSVISWNMHPEFNLVPLIDIVNNPPAYIRNTILNIVLFMPLGFLLSALWKEYRSLRMTAAAGFLLSLFIEILQIFSFRLTDVDDLITNTAGAVLGYCISRRIDFRLPFGIKEDKNGKSGGWEPVILFGIVFLISFFLKSVLSNVIWGGVLESPLWESIR